MSGSETCHNTEAASSDPAAGRSTVDRLSSVWSTAGILSPRISITVATPNRISALLLEMKSNEAPSSMTPQRARPPARSRGSQARIPAQAARPMPMARDGTIVVQSTAIPSMSRD